MLTISQFNLNKGISTSKTSEETTFPGMNLSHAEQLAVVGSPINLGVSAMEIPSAMDLTSKHPFSDKGDVSFGYSKITQTVSPNPEPIDVSVDMDLCSPLPSDDEGDDTSSGSSSSSEDDTRPHLSEQELRLAYANVTPYSKQECSTEMPKWQPIQDLDDIDYSSGDGEIVPDFVEEPNPYDSSDEEFFNNLVFDVRGNEPEPVPELVSLADYTNLNRTMYSEQGNDFSSFDNINVHFTLYLNWNRIMHSQNGNMESPPNRRFKGRPFESGSNHKPKLDIVQKKSWKPSNKGGGGHKQSNTLSAQIAELDSIVKGTKDAARELREEKKRLPVEGGQMIENPLFVHSAPVSPIVAPVRTNYIENPLNTHHSTTVMRHRITALAPVSVSTVANDPHKAPPPRVGPIALGAVGPLPTAPVPADQPKPLYELTFGSQIPPPIPPPGPADPKDPRKTYLDKEMSSDLLFDASDKFNIKVELGTQRVRALILLFLVAVACLLFAVPSVDVYGFYPATNMTMQKEVKNMYYHTFCDSELKALSVDSDYVLFALDFEGKKATLDRVSTYIFNNFANINLDIYNLDDLTSFRDLIRPLIPSSKHWDGVEFYKAFAQSIARNAKISIAKKCQSHYTYFEEVPVYGRTYEHFVAFTVSATWSARLMLFFVCIYIVRLIIIQPATFISVEFKRWQNGAPMRDERADLSTMTDIRHNDPKFAWVEVEVKRQIQFDFGLFHFGVNVAALPHFPKRKEEWLISMELFSQLNHPKYVNFLNTPETVLADLMYGARSSMTINLSRSLAVGDYHQRNLVSSTVHCVYYAYLEHLKNKEQWNFLLPEVKVIASFTGTGLEKLSYRASALLNLTYGLVRLLLVTSIAVFLFKFLLLEFALGLLFLMVILVTRVL